jgi:hypothetical protein
VVLVNYKNTAFDGITVKFPATGTWHLMCNGTNAVSDKASALGSITVSGATHAIDLPARTALVYMSDNVLP